MKRVAVGKIVSTHGVKGLVKILPLADPSLLDSDVPFYTDEQGGQTLSITLKNPVGRYILANVEGVTDRTAAEALRLTDLYIDKSTLPKIEEGTYYHADLIGLKAIDEAGAEIGKIIAVANYGAGDMLEIRPLSGKAFFVPFTTIYVPEVDIKTGIVRTVDISMFKDMA